jgi:hypothetical protein
MVNSMLRLSLARLRQCGNTFVFHGHAMPITPTFCARSVVISMEPSVLQAGRSSVPIFRGGPPLDSR